MSRRPRAAVGAGLSRSAGTRLRRCSGRRWLALLALVSAAGCGAPPAFDLERLGLPPADSLPPAAAAEIEPLEAEVERLAGAPETPPADLGTALGRLGMLYQRYELDAAALACFAAAGELDPEQPRWPYYAGYVHAERGDLDAAVAAFERALHLDPEASWTLLRLGDAELARGDGERAAELYRRVLAIAPDAAAAHHGLGRAALAAGDVEAAIAAFEATLAAAPAATTVHHPLAQAYRRAGREAEARRALERAGQGEVPRTDPPLADLLGQPGGGGLLDEAQLALRAGRRDEGERLLRAAIEHDPDELTARYNLAVLLARSGRAAEAEEQYRAVLARDPSSTTSRFNLATLVAEQGRLEEAVAELERVVEEAPDFEQARHNLAAALVRLGRWQRAAEEYADLARRDPADPELALLHAASLVEAGRPDAAAAELAQLVEAHPERPGYRVELARALVAAGRSGEARATLETALAELPRSGELAHALARLLATAPDPSVRDPARAVRLAQAVWDARPEVEHGRTLAAALAAAGRREDAARAQRQALSALEAASEAGAAFDPAYRARLEDELRRYQRTDAAGVPR